MGATLSAALSNDCNMNDILNYQFHGPFTIEDETNGLYFNGIYLPEEIVILILSYVNPQYILNASSVCKRWCNIIKSTTFWTRLYEQKHNKPPEKLPWYVFYCYFSQQLLDNNLLKNGNGQEGFKYWQIIENGGNKFIVEQTPQGADRLPPDIPEFNGHKSCFATSFDSCIKRQEIQLKSKLLYYIVNKFKPNIYMSEWVAGRFDCGCVYILTCLLKNNLEVVYDKSSQEFRVEQWKGKKWTKVQLLIKTIFLLTF